MQSIRFKEAIRVRSNACIGGAMEKEGPLGAYLDDYDETTITISAEEENFTFPKADIAVIRLTIDF